MMTMSERVSAYAKANRLVCEELLRGMQADEVLRLCTKIGLTTFQTIYMMKKTLANNKKEEERE